MRKAPQKKKVEKLNKQLAVHFNHAQGLKTIDHKAPRGFWVADESMQWKPAEAKLQGETVILSNSSITNPLYVRYAFAGKPDVNLVNGANLPAYPFRTDNQIPVVE